ncbi:SRPBCC family protein [Fervidobacterium pennivorans]|uniref:SRPBCC family protein n=1 Tax=Fervidobacterium pennivorans TaxID=93466 RepID=UPI002479EE09|nr:SRPBCC domain-containing protein [Fervidobacterium pennivorans]
MRLTDGEEVTDRGKVIAVVEERIFEFYWYEYEDGFRSRVEFKLTPVDDEITLLEIRDKTFVKDESELHIRYGCAYGWGQFVLLLKTYLEKGLVLI